MLMLIFIIFIMQFHNAIFNLALWFCKILTLGEAGEGYLGTLYYFCNVY